MLKLKNLSKFYYNKGIVASGISKINLELKIGEFVAITGESGSGKSTLLNVLSGLDTYEEGELFINNEETSHYTEKDYEDYRRKYVSNIFQNFNLISSYTVYQNIELIMLLNGCNKKDVKDKVNELIKKVNLTKFKNTKASKLSGGQKQRVAIARALAKDTPIIIADEPTGNLDSKAAKEVIDTLKALSEDKLIIIVTHNYEQVKDYVTRKIRMNDGKVLEDKTIVKVENTKATVANTGVINFKSKFALMLRNTFNIPSKLLLLIAVFLLLGISITGKYASDRRQDDQLYENGYNNSFYSANPNRIIFSKSDKSAMTEEDFNKVSDISNHGLLVKNDLILDSYLDLTNNEYVYYYGDVELIDSFEGKVEYGRLPEAENELLLQVNENYFYNSPEEIFEETFDQMNGYMLNYNNEFKIVGITFSSSSSYNDVFYASEETAKTIYLINYYMFGVNLKISGKDYEYQSYTNIMVLDSLDNGEVLFSENLCVDCKNDNIKLINELKYNTNELDLKVIDIVNDNNKSIYGVKDNNPNYWVDPNSNYVYLSKADFESLIYSENYQSSVIVEDIMYVDGVASDLEKLGYDVFVVRDTIITEDVIGVLNTIITIIMLICLFFITYFVIKLIFKSRNIYYTTIRILGANKKVAKDLLTGELLIIATVTYAALLIIVNSGVINVEFFNNIKDYMTIEYYIVVYVLLILMSYLISIRYSSKLFKNSVITTLSEEV